jgi:hypothetical protein
MAVNAPKDSAIDVRLPNTPEQSLDPKIFAELMIVYTAIRSLQAGLANYDVPRYTTSNAPAYKKGRMYFDTTLNKLRVGGATAYETISST